MDGLTDHLATECREAFPHGVIDQMVEFHTIPATVFHDKGNDGLADLREKRRQSRERLGLLAGCEEFEGSSPFHFVIFSSIRMGVKHPFLPALKDGVSWTIR
jgi:hypothetical protein